MAKARSVALWYRHYVGDQDRYDGKCDCILRRLDTNWGYRKTYISRTNHCKPSGYRGKLKHQHQLPVLTASDLAGAMVL